MTDISKSAWISIPDAIRYIADRTRSGEWEADGWLEDGLAAGKIHARASRVVELESYTSQPRKVLDANSDTVWIELAQEFWRDAFFDTPNDWGAQRGLATIVSTNGTANFEVENLQFLGRDLRNWIRNQSFVPSAPSMRGRPLNELAWAEFIVELIDLERSGELTEDRFPNAKDLVDWYEATFDDKSDEGKGVLNVRTVRVVILSVWETMVKGNKTKSVV